MTRATRPSPEGYPTITPHLVVRDAGAAIEFYTRAFGATESFRSLGPDGTSVLHAELRLGDSALLLIDESEEWGTRSPRSLGGSPVTMHLYVADVDAVFDRATKAGAEVTMPVAGQFWGDRYGKLVDPFGHHWSIATHVEDLSPHELARRQAAAFQA
jgi:PhnB protein